MRGLGPAPQGGTKRRGGRSSALPLFRLHLCSSADKRGYGNRREGEAPDAPGERVRFFSELLKIKKAERWTG